MADKTVTLYAPGGTRIDVDPVRADEFKTRGYTTKPKSDTATSGEVSCDVDGCDYRGTKRGLKIHTGQVHN